MVGAVIPSGARRTSVGGIDGSMASGVPAVGHPEPVDVSGDRTARGRRRRLDRLDRHGQGGHAGREDEGQGRCNQLGLRRALGRGRPELGTRRALDGQGGVEQGGRADLAGAWHEVPIRLLDHDAVVQRWRAHRRGQLGNGDDTETGEERDERRAASHLTVKMTSGDHTRGLNGA